jgi:hypothetical protein
MRRHCGCEQVPRRRCAQCLHSHRGRAVASQAFFNPYYGPRELALLVAGATAEDTIRLLTAAAEGRESRQVHVMDRWGRFAAFTGQRCADWRGPICWRAIFSLARKFWKPWPSTYEAESAPQFARRLIATIRAGERAGGRTGGWGQAWAAIAVAVGPRRRGVLSARSALRRPSRLARRNRTARGDLPSVLGARSAAVAKPQQPRRASRPRAARRAHRRIDRRGI